MNNLTKEKNLRILVVDDNRAIHEDFRKILCPAATAGNALADAEAVLFDVPDGHAKRMRLGDLAGGTTFAINQNANDTHFVIPNYKDTYLWSGQ